MKRSIIWFALHEQDNSPDTKRVHEGHVIDPKLSRNTLCLFKCITFVLIGIFVWCQAGYSQTKGATTTPDRNLFAQAVKSATNPVSDTDTSEADSTDTGKDEKKGGKSKVKVLGFIQFNFLEHIDSNGDNKVLPDRFRIQRARVTFKGKINKHISYEMDIDPRAPEITGIMRDAYISMDYIPYHDLRLGQQKTQFGYENNVSSSRLYFVNRTDVSDNLSRGINLRDTGIGLIGKVPLSDNYRFEDAVTIVNGAGMNLQYDNTKKKNIWGRVGIRYKNDDVMWRVGISGAYGDMPDEGEDEIDTADDYILDFKRVGTDVEIEHKRFTMAAEYIAGWDDEPEEVADIAGYYLILTGKTRWDAGPLLRYESVDDGEFSRWIIGAYYGMPKARFRVLANYEFRHVEEDPEFPNGEDNRFYLWCQTRF